MKTRPLAILAVVLASTFALTAQTPARYDVAIVNGMIVDGSGNPWYRADLAIRDGHIVAITPTGAIDPAGAATVIDATGKAVTPGFIDMHTHSDLALVVDGTAQSKVREGVTLDIIGESSSVAPLEGVIAGQFRSDAKRRYDIDVDWTNFTGYFDRLMKQGISMNVASSVAPQQIKRAVIGFTNRPATPPEMEKMNAMVATAMREGAVGLSAAYEGGGYDNPEETFAMAAVAHKYGGYYGTHVGSEGFQLNEEIRKAIDVADKTGIPVHIYHLKIRGRELWGKVDPAIKMIEAARARGLEITANQYPYTAMQHPWAALFPEWAKDGGPNRILEVLGDADEREKLKRDPRFKQYVAEHGGFEGIVASRFDNVKDKPLEGKSIAEIAKLRGDLDPADTCFNLVLEEGHFVDGVHHNMDEADVKHIMQLPWVSIASDGSALRPDGVLGDGLPHPRSYGTNPRVLGRYVRDEHTLTLEDAIRKMTSLPAQVLRLKDRGLLKEGYWADVVVFDPATVKDNGTYDVPEQYPTGITNVLVNGVPVIMNGEHTGAKPGKVIYGHGYETKKTN